MSVMVAAAMICAAALAWLFHPLMKARALPPRMAMGVAGAMALGALGLYLMLGNPDLPGQPALFEKTGARAEQRALTGKELTLMQALAAEPQNVDLMLSLAAVRLQAGRPDDALGILEAASRARPGNRDIDLERGAAHYAAALMLLAEGDRAGALFHLEEGLKIAPRDAAYRGEIEAATARLKK